LTLAVAAAVGVVRDPKALVRTAQEAAAPGSAQLFTATMVVGSEHLLVAAERAGRAFAEGTAVCDSLPLETLLYASGERQISAALAKMGVKVGDDAIALLCWDTDPDRIITAIGFRREDSRLDPDPAKLRAFGLTDLEISTVPAARAVDLVLERVALVDLLKR